MFAEISTEQGKPRTENRAPGTGHNEHSTGHNEHNTGNQGARTRRSQRRARSIHAERTVDTRAVPALAPWPQAVPIGEVGMRIRTPDDQGGMVVDVQDIDGTLTYLVQLDGQATAQLIPARALKGVQL